MNNLYVPHLDRQPHWFWRWRIVDRVYVLSCLWMLYQNYTLLLQIQRIIDFNVYFSMSHATSLQTCIVLGYFGASALLLPRLTYPFLVLYVSFMFMLADGAFHITFGSSAEAAMIVFYRYQLDSTLFFWYVGVKWSLWLLRRLKHYRDDRLYDRYLTEQRARC